MPKAINPETGYAVTCNQRVAGHDYPYYVGLCFAPEHRARRVQAGILALEPKTATVDDMAGIHADRISEPARIFTRALIEIEPLEADSAAALALMREWDYSMDRDLAQPLIYAKTKAHLVQRIVEHLLGDFASEVLSEAAGSGTVLRQIVEQMTLGIERGDTSITPHGGEWEGLLAAGLGDAVRELRDSFGEDMSEWRWGRLHRTEPRHPLSEVFPEAAEHLDPPSVETHGDGDTPLAGGYGLQQEFVPTGISVNRYIHDPSDWTNSRWIVPLGASGHPGSPHYADQAEAWANVEYIPQLWAWDEIRREAESHQRLEPRGSGV